MLRKAFLAITAVAAIGLVAGLSSTAEAGHCHRGYYGPSFHHAYYGHGYGHYYRRHRFHHGYGHHYYHGHHHGYYGRSGLGLWIGF